MSVINLMVDLNDLISLRFVPSIKSPRHLILVVVESVVHGLSGILILSPKYRSWFKPA